MSGTKTKVKREPIEVEDDSAPDDGDFTLEDQLYDHLAIPESAMRLYRERFSVEMLSGREVELRNAVEFVFSHIEKEKVVPTPEVIEYETGAPFEAPKTEIGWLIEKIRDRHKRNKTKEVLTAAARKASSAPDEALNLAVSSLSELQALTAPRVHELSTRDWGVRLEAYRQRVLAGSSVGYSFGWEEVDRHIGGLKQGEVAYVIGRPKRFKSWMLLKSAVEVAMHPVKPGRAVLFSLEMTEQVMFDRYMCMAAGVNYKHFVDGVLDAQDQKIMAECQEEIDENPDASNLIIAHPPQSQRTVQGLRQYALEHGADVIYIDQLSFVKSTRAVPADKRHLEIEYINEDLREAAQDFPIYIAAQFNREAANLGEMADLSKIGLSDSIGQKADILLGLYQNKDMRENKILEFGVIEARNYGIHRWEIGINFDHTSFKIDSKKMDF